ncbi:MAG: hypothetical protein V4485_03145 [Pseudomonadota bacterium]
MVFWLYYPLAHTISKIITEEKPDVIFDPYLHALGIKNTEESLEIYAGRLPKFTKTYWVNWFGQRDAVIHKKNLTLENHTLITASNHKVNLLYKEFDCNADMVLNMIDDRHCVDVLGANLGLNLSEIREYGTIFVFCTKDGCKMEYQDSERFKFEK